MAGVDSSGRRVPDDGPAVGADMEQLPRAPKSTVPLEMAKHRLSYGFGIRCAGLRKISR